ncbi:sugar ABC transporter substrate-binding protein [Cohnella sp.]|uniref:sugar ABC transporter substrate-binding protein n=1 Tax=Cohnella sp. TaxID=1883426 RepID=UPI0037047066
MKKLWSVLLVMIMASSLLAACGGSTNKSNEAKPSSSAGASGTAAPDNSDLIKDGIGTDFGFGPIGHDMEGLVKRMGAKAEGLKIGISVSTQENDWMVEWVKSLKKMCETNGLECIVTDAQGKPEKQVEDLKSLQNQNVDGIILFPQEEKSLVQVLGQLEGKIPVVPTIPIDGAKVAAYIDVNQQLKGELGATALKAAFNGEQGNILVFDLVGRVDFAINRIEGFTRAVEKIPNLKIVETQSYGTAEEYLSATKNILASREDINAIYTPYGVSMVAAAQALKQMNRKDVKIVGVDGDVVILGLVKEGWITGTNPQSPQQNGSIGLFTLLRLINGENVQSPVWEPPAYAALWATPENAEDFSMKLWGRAPVSAN